MIDRIRDFNKNYSNIVFLIIMIFVLITLIFISFNNRNKPKECIIPQKIVANSVAYSYNIKITQDDIEIAKLYIKRFASKYLIEVNMDNNKETYYLRYTEFLKKNSDGKYSLFVPNELISGIDNKYLIFDFINDLSLDSDIITREERPCYVNRKENTIMCVNLDKTLELSVGSYKLIYEIDDNYIDDFDVSIEKIVLEENVNTVE